MIEVESEHIPLHSAAVWPACRAVAARQSLPSAPERIAGERGTSTHSPVRKQKRESVAGTLRDQKMELTGLRSELVRSLDLYGSDGGFAVTT